MQSKRIFITGVTGLVGSHIARLLVARGYSEITALRRSSSALDLVGDIKDKINWIEGDLTFYDDVEAAMRGADWVIHSAALISYQRRMRDRLHKVNVDGTANVVNASLHHGVGKLLHISSMAVFTRNGGKQHVDESTPWEQSAFTSEYGLTKHLAEMEVWRGNAEGLDVHMLLPTIVMGSGFWDSGSTTMFAEAAKGLTIYPVGHTGFVDVRDIALLAVLTLEAEQAPQRMIVSGWNRPFKDVLTQICEKAGTRTPSIALNPKVAEIAWRLVAPLEWFSKKEPVLTKNSARTTACKQTFDNSRSLSVPGMTYTPLERTIEDVMSNYAIAKEDGFRAIPMQFLPHHL